MYISRGERWGWGGGAEMGKIFFSLKKGKIDMLEFIKMDNFHASKDAIKKMKREVIGLVRKLLVNPIFKKMFIFYKGFVSIIYRELVEWVNFMICKLHINKV